GSRRGPSSRRAASSRGDASSRVESRSRTPEGRIKHSSASASNSDGGHLNPDATPITIHDQRYYKAEDIASKGKKTSYIWENGYALVHAEKGTKHFYCKLCLDEG